MEKYFEKLASALRDKLLQDLDRKKEIPIKGGSTKFNDIMRIDINRFREHPELDEMLSGQPFVFWVEGMIRYMELHKKNGTWGALNTEFWLQNARARYDHSGKMFVIEDLGRHVGL